MRKTTEDLLNLQSHDMAVRELEAKFKTIPSERAACIREFENVRAIFQSAKEKQQKLERQIRACETAILEEQDRLKQAKIKSGTIKKQAEFDALNTEIQYAQDHISELETQTLVFMDELDGAKEEAEAAEKTYQAVGRRQQKAVRDLDALKERILSDVKQHAEAARACEANVAQAALAEYKRLLAFGKGLPISPMENGNCGNCGLKVSAATINELSKGALVPCEHCSFKLYDPKAG